MDYPYKVSVIIPVYGVENYIERCARSLMEQTLESIEFLFIDDCSTDCSIEILNQVVDQYPQRKSQVVVHRMEHNSGQAAVRKWGMQNASGEYVIHCDGDDWVSSDMYHLMYEKAKEDNSDIVICDYYLSDGNESVPVRQDKADGLLTGPLWNKLIRNSLIKCSNIVYPTHNKAEDGALMVQISYFAHKYSLIHRPLYYYYQNPSSICNVMTEEAMLKRFYDEVCNTDLRIDFLINQGALDCYKNDVLVWKRVCRSNLEPFLGKRCYRQMWRNTYPEINMQYVFSRSISLKSKIKFVLNYLGIHI